MRTIKLISVLIIAGLVFSGCQQKNEETKAKYIFLFIGDGMGNSHVAAAESYLSYKAGKHGGERLSFTEFPYLALAETFSARETVTCSSAAGTAIASGVKTYNSMLGVDPEGNPLKSIASILHEEGYNVGIMSSVPANHATPAAFYAHVPYRGNYYDISRQIPESGFEFIGGAGLYHMRGKEGDLPHIEGYLEENGYEVCYGKNEYTTVRDSVENIVLLQPSAREGEAAYYVSDNREEGDMSLSEMVSTCLDFLGEEKPFFIMCEGGDIDWAGHSNHTMAMVDNILEFDKAVRTALEFYAKHPEETVIIVTADHETGGISLGEGRKWKSDLIGWQALEEQWVASGKSNKLTYEENAKLNADNMVGWTTSNHTGAPVPTYAIGKGSEAFHGRIQNTDIMKKILGE